MTASARRNFAIALGLFVLMAISACSLEPVRDVASIVWRKSHDGYSVSERLEQFAPAVASRVQAKFEAAGLTYPPYEVAYLSFKDSRTLEVYARMSSSESWRFIEEYTVFGASGSLGPKLAEGDKQVPEGLYRVEYLNPNSRFHLSLGLNYPNEFDKRMAQVDGRTQLGGDIMIHGSSLSIGCLAVGDRAAEDLFVIAALVSTERVRVLISPTDFRRPSPIQLTEEPAWVHLLYLDLRTELQQFRREPNKTFEMRRSASPLEG